MNRYQRCAVVRPRIVVAAIMTVLAWAAALPAHADDVDANQSGLIRRLLPTVVNIAVRKQETASPTAPPVTATAPAPAPDASPNTTSPSIKSFVGSGFVIDPAGLIVTNYHVVQDASEVTVTFSDGKRLSGKTLSASRTADLALVKVEANHPLPVAQWGDSDALQVGDQVFAAGNPFGLGLSVSAGIVSGLNRDIQNSPYDDLIQTDATINHGNSGGPLFDMQGNVVGVDAAIISPTAGSAGLGFAIPSSSARFVVDQLRRYGWVRPGWIGVKVQTVTPDIADAMGMARPEGMIVAWVLPYGPAKKAGLEIGDIILGYNEKTPTDDRALLRLIAQTQVGDKVTMAVRHEGTLRNIPITVESWPRNKWDALDAPMPTQQPKIVIPPDLGLTLAAMSADDRTKLSLPDGVDGVLVTEIAANADAARRGVADGDIILRVQDAPVTTPAEVQSGIDAARADKRDFVLMLVLPKVRDVAGPKWFALQISAAGG